MSHFDPTATHISAPNPLRIAVLRQELLPLLQERLQHISAPDIRGLDVLVYLCLYLEHRVEGDKQGALRKQLVMELMAPYYQGPELQAMLESHIDFVVAQHLVRKNGLLKRGAKILMGWLRFKLGC